jgi:hypothetical protein
LFSVQRSALFLRSAIDCTVREKLVSGSRRRHYPIWEKAATHFVLVSPRLVQISCIA